VSVAHWGLKCPECSHGIETCAPLGRIPVWGECANHHSWLVSVPEPGAEPVIAPDPHRARDEQTRRTARGDE
jgi:hypothetical protein